MGLDPVDAARIGLRYQEESPLSDYHLPVLRGSGLQTPPPHFRIIFPRGVYKQGI